jgi:hypothetical protein
LDSIDLLRLLVLLQSIIMSAAAARRRKQLAAKQQAENGGDSNATLKKLLASCDSEPVAYEALQLAQSAVRRKVKDNNGAAACDLAYESSLALLQQGFVSVASQLLTLLVEVLRETQAEETDLWIARLVELHGAFETAMTAKSSTMAAVEKVRLERVQRDWLAVVLTWSSELGTVRYGHPQLNGLAGTQCWKLAGMVAASSTDADTDNKEDDNDKDEFQCDAIQHMALAERPDTILTWLQSLPTPTAEQTKAGHTCSPAPRDALLTRAVLVFCAVENLRDATTLLQQYAAVVEERDLTVLAASYTKKDDGIAPAHVIFGNMLVRICQKDMRTGPLFQWLVRSFKREMDLLSSNTNNNKSVDVYITRIGKIYFNIQPPPGLMNMMENMMGMMGGGGMGGGGMNPALMQAALAQMQGMK